MSGINFYCCILVAYLYNYIIVKQYQLYIIYHVCKKQKNKANKKHEKSDLSKTCCCKKKRQNMNESFKDIFNLYDAVKNNVTHEVTTHNFRK